MSRPEAEHRVQHLFPKVRIGSGDVDVAADTRLGPYKLKDKRSDVYQIDDIP